MKFVDLFCGIGGFHLAAKKFNMECVYSCDIDKYVCGVYKNNFGINPLHDITKVNVKDIASHDFLFAGFPCQPFSIAGNKLGFQDTQGTLFFDICRIIDFHKPKFLLLENVKNLASHDKGNTLKTIINSLIELGYTIEYKLLNATNFGLRQSRERIYIVGIREDLSSDNFKFPEKNSIKYLEEILEEKVDDKYFITRDDIVIDKSDKEHSSKPIRIGSIGPGRQGERIYSIKGQGITLSAQGGGVAGKTGAYLVGDKIRKLTPRECARLQGFEEDFQICEREPQAYKQFGNAVPVKVVENIIENIYASQ